MKPRLAQAFSVISVLLVADLIVQFFLAGAAVFTFMRSFDDTSSASIPAAAYRNAAHNMDFWWGIHVGNAALVFLLILLMLILSFAARKPWMVTGLIALFIPLLFLQSIFAHGVPAPYAGLHVVNGVAILGLSVYLAMREWAFRKPVSPY
ncbi:MAG: hypothetical protein M3082_12660 [Candidatus Dormibacteraeota bacterium]|nr:hypothetical protein [Candidatus Dormibacteraeota bacterium]